MSAVAVSISVELLNEGHDAWLTCGSCGEYLAVVGDYDKLPVGGYFNAPRLPLRIGNRIVRHVCDSDQL